MNRDIHDMRFDGSEEDLLLQDFISRAEPANVVGERIMARVYEKIQTDRARRSKRWWLVAAAVMVPLLACGVWLGLNLQANGPHPERNCKRDARTGRANGAHPDAYSARRHTHDGQFAHPHQVPKAFPRTHARYIYNR